MKRWIIHIVTQYRLKKFFNAFEAMYKSVYKNEKKNNPAVNSHELRMKMWNDLHELASMQWQWDNIKGNYN